jgi:hypothetical protein
MHYDANRMRFELLRALYQHAQKHPEEVFSEAELIHEFDVSPIQFDLVVEWLRQNGYARVTGAESDLSITEKGLNEMDERTTHWRREIEAILLWLTQEKERIGRDCASRGMSEQGMSRTEIEMKKTAIYEARQRRKALEARMRDLREPIARG